MGSKKFKGRMKSKRRYSEPADCADVAKQVSEAMDRSCEEVCHTTTQTALEFFRISWYLNWKKSENDCQNTLIARFCINHAIYTI